MRALMFASVASMVDLFNRDNIKILEELGYKVDVAANFSEGSVYSAGQAKRFKKELIRTGHDVIDVPVPRSMYDIAGMVKTVIRLRKHMAARHYDIIHCQSPIGGVLCRLAAAPFRKKGTKVVYYAHGFHFYKGADLFNRIVFYNIEKICARITDCIITLNQEDYGAASRKFAARVEYVRGIGLNLEEIERVPVERESVRKELGIPADKKIILSVCELSRRKNCAAALEAFARADRDDAVLVMCGIGEQMDMLKKLTVTLGVDKKVIFAGFCNDIIRMFKASDMFIFTSKQEGLPAALMQAMACGLPVVCSRIRGNTDLIENKKQGFMCAYDNVDGFCKGIHILLDNPKLRRKMGSRSMEVIKLYDKKYVNEKMREIYLSLTDKNL